MIDTIKSIGSISYIYNQGLVEPTEPMWECYTMQKMCEILDAYNYKQAI